MPEFFLRKNDPLQPVYAVDATVRRWWLAASSIGVMPELTGDLPDDVAARFQSEDLEQVWPKTEDEGRITFTRVKPADVADA